MRFTGTHIIGRSRAHTLGFPTINLHDITSITEEGVYATRVTINNELFKSIMFVGASPTFNNKEKSVELHLIGQNTESLNKHHLGSLITKKICVEIVGFIRSIKKFSSRDELIKHIEKDIDDVLVVLSTDKSLLGNK